MAPIARFVIDPERIAHGVPRVLFSPDGGTILLTSSEGLYRIAVGSPRPTVLVDGKPPTGM